MKDDFSGLVCFLFFFINFVDEFIKFCSKAAGTHLKDISFLKKKKIGLSHFCLRAAETNISLVSRVFLVRK